MTYIALARSSIRKAARKCVLCGASFWAQSARQKTCSLKCSTIVRQAYRAGWRADPANQARITAARKRYSRKQEEA
jgi:hypothetical protein